jgi:hypothetical protein
LTSVVGTGGFGTVFKARQLQLDRVVAVKVVEGEWDQAVAARFESEARLHGGLHHPNIVEVYDYGRHGDRMYIAMEFLEGEDLARRVCRAGPVPEWMAWGIARQTAAALDYAAAAGLVHRDVKPANLFLCQAPPWSGLPDGVPLVKVTDFGLALARVGIPTAGARPRSPAVLLGTPLYMAPEQYRQPEEIDHRADIYALGATVYQAITGRPPFEGMQVGEIMEHKLASGLRLDDDISPESARLLRDMTSADPNGRPGTYSGLIARIDRLPPVRHGPVAPPRPGCGLFRRRRGLLLVVPAAAAAVAAVTVLGRNSWADGPPPRDVKPPGRFASTGDHVSLFEGPASLLDWLPPAPGGIWQTATDEDREPVLLGEGFTRRAFRPAENYRLTLGVDVYQADAVEVHCGVPAADPESGDRFVLAVSRSGGAVFGVRAGNAGEFRPLGRPVPFPKPEWFRDRKPYLEFRVERAGPRWLAWFNGTPAGGGDDDGRPKAHEVRVNAAGGRARINSVELTPLRGP